MQDKKISIRVAGILIRDNKILLIQHKKEKKKYWLVPGGNLEYSENIHTCLIREFKEELFLEILVQDFLFLVETISPDKERHILNLFYKVVAPTSRRLDNSRQDAGVCHAELVSASRLRFRNKFGMTTTSSITANGDCQDIKIGNEERLNAVGFFSYDELDNLIIYPDIKTELKMVLKGKQIKSLSLVKKWI